MWLEVLGTVFGLATPFTQTGKPFATGPQITGYNIKLKNQNFCAYKSNLSTSKMAGRHSAMICLQCLACSAAENAKI